jgi:transglutaminase-like putative cysteine protease
MKYKLIHNTRYKYQDTVSSYHSLACLTPKTLPQQICNDFSIHITPAPDKLVKRVDFFGNILHYFSIHAPHKELTVLTKSNIIRLPQNGDLSLFDSNISCKEARRVLQEDFTLKNQLLQFMLPSTFVNWDDEIRDFARDCFVENTPLFECAKALCHKIFKEFTYLPNFTTINTPIKTVLKEKKGVCQDFSHLGIACLRSMGFAARYVSGYIETIPPKGKPKMKGSDASHAWISVFIPGQGWCDFDPTNDLIPQERHITTAWGRDYGDVAPLKGLFFGSGKHILTVEVDVLPLD